MTPAFTRRSMMLAVLGAWAMAAQAAPTQFSTGQVVVDFDPDTFTFSHDVTSFGGISTEDISPSSVTVSALGNGFELNFNNQMTAYATSYTNFSPESLNGNFNAPFTFSPAAGYIITGYSVTYAGTYAIETPGSVSVSGPGGGFNASLGGGNFNTTFNVGVGGTFNLTGGINAYGDITTVQVFDHYDSVFDHYDQVLDYCEVDDPTVCHYTEVPVYVDVPVYRDETDLGEASINLQSITVQAQVAAVPEPEALVLLAIGGPLAGWLARRRRRA